MTQSKIWPKSWPNLFRKDCARCAMIWKPLVTREEFEVQEAVLARTREKLELLEARLKEIEAAQ
jgi:hypothetical protein